VKTYSRCWTVCVTVVPLNCRTNVLTYYWGGLREDVLDHLTKSIAHCHSWSNIVTCFSSSFAEQAPTISLSHGTMGPVPARRRTYSLGRPDIQTGPVANLVRGSKRRWSTHCATYGMQPCAHIHALGGQQDPRLLPVCQWSSTAYCRPSG
jgi:hypothetical protein